MHIHVSLLPSQDSEWLNQLWTFRVSLCFNRSHCDQNYCSCPNTIRIICGGHNFSTHSDCNFLSFLQILNPVVRLIIQFWSDWEPHPKACICLWVYSHAKTHNNVLINLPSLFQISFLLHYTRFIELQKKLKFWILKMTYFQHLGLQPC